MKRLILEKLCCPSCRVEYHVKEVQAPGDSIERAFLTCPVCCITVPVLNGFPFFEEQRLSEAWDLDPLSRSLFGTEQEYNAFLELKKIKPVYDLYAAFQPFNESTQSIFPLIPLLREVVQPGSFILDLWCRTGWSGELLASLFPEQFVIAIWESSSGLLGTKGFHYWLGSGKRLKNLEIVFHSPNSPFPFPDGFFSVVHGLDTIHRYKHMPFIPECLRIVKRDGVLVFPHNHLTNSEPDPYFDRGEDQLHGKEYHDYFGRLLKNSGRKAFVLSEKTLFDAGSDYVLKDEANTDHYNACLLVAASRHEGSVIHRPPKSRQDYENAQIIINPLLCVDPTTGEALPADEAMDTGGSELFFRHPMYHNRLKKYSPIHLSQEQRIIYYWACQQKTVSNIAAILKKDVDHVFHELLEMESKELIQIQNVSSAMARLQSFYSTQQIPVEPGRATLKHLWERTQRLHGEDSFLVWPQDDSVFSYSDSDLIVRKTMSFLISEGVSAGDRVVIEAVSHPEFVFLFWAAVLLRAVVVPVNAEMKSDSWNLIVRNTQPRLILRNSENEERLSPVITFGVSEDSPAFENSFSSVLAGFEPVAEFSDVSEKDEAVILFTSGSTGRPKGIFLSHGALYRTSQILDHAYKWRTEDRFLSGGTFHTMSGLRNPCIAVLHSGASIVVPPKEDLQNPLSLLGLCVNYGVTILNVTPGFLAYWGRTAQKSKYFHSHKLRLVLSTGSALQPVHREVFGKQFGVPIYDYYGLTETTGACILETEEITDLREKGIGRPWGCIANICGDGELAIYSENLMLGYLQDPAATARRIQDGWLMTGDIARVNETGCIVLIGRKDRMMKDKHGELVYPEVIESAISALDQVGDVYVISYKDDLAVDQIAAMIEIQRTPEDLEGLFSTIRTELSKKISSAHIPVFMIAVSEMPRGAGGKISGEAVKTLILQEIKRRRQESGSSNVI